MIYQPHSLALDENWNYVTKILHMMTYISIFEKGKSQTSQYADGPTLFLLFNRKLLAVTQLFTSWTELQIILSFLSPLGFLHSIVCANTRDTVPYITCYVVYENLE